MTPPTFNPLADRRWDDLVATHRAASIFHTRGWLEALHRTYGFDPLVFTTSPPDAPLSNGIVTCSVRSWITGTRLVSVPFADHCDPLVGSEAEASQLIASLEEATRHTWKYVELRPRAPFTSPDPRLHEAASFRLHAINLRDDLDKIFRRMHESGVRRRIRRAERAGLRYEEGRSKALLDVFFDLFVLTRKRHGAPPPPREWFANLISAVGAAAKIRVAWKDRRPIAAIVTLEHRTTMVYKYGGSDAAFHNLGAMPFLFWRAIQEAKTTGHDSFDLGRSDLTNDGLNTFKERLGGTPSALTYWRYSTRGLRQRSMIPQVSAGLLAWLPKPVLVTTGRFLYRHIA